MDKIRTYQAHPVAMLFARFLDEKFLEFINKEIKETSSLLVGATESLKYGKEIELMGSFIYYMSCLISLGSTLGQQFCGLKMLHVISDRQGKEYVDRITSKKKFAVAAFLYALLPYLYSRKAEIMSAIAAFWSILTEREEISVNAEDNESLEIGRNQDGFSDSSLELREAIEVNDGVLTHKSSIFSVVGTSLYRSFMSLSHETNIRFDRLISFGFDCHNFLFSLYGR